MKITLFNDTEQVWWPHAGSDYQGYVAPQEWADLETPAGAKAVFIKVWEPQKDGYTYLVRFER